MDTRRVSSENTSSTSQQSKRELGEEFDKVCAAVRAGNSVIVLGEAGSGKTDFALALHKEMSGEYQAAISTYKGSIKKFFIAIGFASARSAIAMQLDCPTTDERDRPLTVDALNWSLD